MMLKPIDIVVLVRVLTLGREDRTQTTVAQRLGVSQSNVHRAFRQLEKGGLWKDRTPQRQAIFDVLKYGVRHVYPAELGPPARGVPTAHAGPATATKLQASPAYVWPHDSASAFGPSLVPLHPAVPATALRDPAFHEFMALVDVFRVGRVRDRALAERRLRVLLDLPRVSRED